MPFANETNSSYLILLTHPIDRHSVAGSEDGSKNYSDISGNVAVN